MLGGWEILTERPRCETALARTPSRIIEIDRTLFSDALDPDAAVFATLRLGEHHGAALRRGEWKLIAVRSPKDRQMMTGASYELYDVIADPHELNNRVEERPEIVANLSRVLQDWFTGGARWKQQGEEIDLQSLSPEEQEMLRSLGYLK